MTPPPRWLAEYLTDHLDELAPFSTDTPESHAGIKEWFDRLLQKFTQRELATPYQQRNRLVDARNVIRAKFGPDHPAMKIVAFDEATWVEINNHTPDNPRKKDTAMENAPAEATATKPTAKSAAEATAKPASTEKSAGKAPEASKTPATPASASPTPAAAAVRSAAEIEAKLKSLVECRDLLSTNRQQEIARLDAERRRLEEVRKDIKNGKGKPEPKPAEASAAPQAATTAPVASAPPAPPVTKPASGPGWLDRMMGLWTGVKNGIDPRNWVKKAVPARRTPVSAPPSGKPAAEAAAAAESTATGAESAGPKTGSEKSIEEQLTEILAEIQAIEARLEEMARQIKALDAEIAELETALAEAHAREGTTPSVAAAAAIPAEPAEVPTGPSFTNDDFSSAESVKEPVIQAAVAHAVANHLRQSDMTVYLQNDYARVAMLDPARYQVRQVGTEEDRGQTIPVFELLAVLDPETNEWVNNPHFESTEAVGASTEEAPDFAAPVAAPSRGRGR